jgi:hypothetical protein
MLSKDDLLGLGMTPGSLFAQVFKAVKAAKTPAAKSLNSG